MCVILRVCKEETRWVQQPVCRFMRGDDKLGEGRIEEGSWSVKRGGSHRFTHPLKVSVSMFVTLCVHVCEHQVYNYKPQS